MVAGGPPLGHHKDGQVWVCQWQSQFRAVGHRIGRRRE